MLLLVVACLLKFRSPFSHSPPPFQTKNYLGYNKTSKGNWFIYSDYSPARVGALSPNTPMAPLPPLKNGWNACAMSYGGWPMGNLSDVWMNNTCITTDPGSVFAFNDVRKPYFFSLFCLPSLTHCHKLPPLDSAMRRTHWMATCPCFPTTLTPTPPTFTSSSAASKHGTCRRRKQWGWMWAVFLSLFPPPRTSSLRGGRCWGFKNNMYIKQLHRSESHPASSGRHP